MPDEIRNRRHFWLFELWSPFPHVKYRFHPLAVWEFNRHFHNRGIWFQVQHLYPAKTYRAPRLEWHPWEATKSVTVSRAAYCVTVSKHCWYMKIPLGSHKTVTVTRQLLTVTGVTVSGESCILRQLRTLLALVYCSCILVNQNLNSQTAVSNPRRTRHGSSTAAATGPTPTHTRTRRASAATSKASPISDNWQQMNQFLSIQFYCSDYRIVIENSVYDVTTDIFSKFKKNTLMPFWLKSEKGDSWHSCIKTLDRHSVIDPHTFPDLQATLLPRCNTLETVYKGKSQLQYFKAPVE